MVPRRLHDAPGCGKMAQDASKMLPRCPQDAPRRGQDASRRAQDAPRCAKMRKTTQDTATMFRKSRKKGDNKLRSDKRRCDTIRYAKISSDTMRSRRLI